MSIRISLGIRQFGRIGADSSADIFLTFSMTNILDASSTTKTAKFLSNDQINSLFEVISQRVEEIDSKWETFSLIDSTSEYRYL